MKTLTCQFLAALLALSLPGQSAVAESKGSPAKPAVRPRMEVCFVLDTTGSMTDLIEGAKRKIWSVANEMAAAKPSPELRLGLIAYRDRGDEYVVKTFDLTNDIDAVYAQLQTLRAAGGGDTPESVNEALQAAVDQLSWSSDRHVLKIVFLVGDAPPHMDYANGPKYPEVCKAAVKKDLVINTIQCGAVAETTPIWNEIAHLAEGSYATIAQSGNMAAIATPMDAELAELNRKLGTTLVAYGSDSARRAVMSKQVLAEAAPASVAADRLMFNVKAGVAVQGDGELLDSLANGKVKLESVKKSDLPADLQKLDDDKLKAEIQKRQQERTSLQARIQKLSRERSEYIAAETKKALTATRGDSFDEKVAVTIRAQAARKGIEY